MKWCFCALCDIHVVCSKHFQCGMVEGVKHCEQNITWLCMWVFLKLRVTLLGRNYENLIETYSSNDFIIWSLALPEM